MKPARQLCFAMLMLTGCTAEEAEKEPVPVALVETATVQTRDRMEERLAVFGVVEAAPEASLPVSADLDASVVRVIAKPGQTVKAGDVLVEVAENRSVRLDAQRARIDVDFAQRELDRLHTARERGLATNADVQAAESALARAKAEQSSLGAPSGNHHVRAPSAGVVRAVVVKTGDVVPAGGALVVLATGDARVVRFGVEPSEIDRFAVGAAVHVSMVDAPDVFVDGKLTQVERQVDPETHMAAVTAAFPQGALLPGALCRGDVVVRSLEHVLTVPRKAVALQGGERAVFIVEGADAAMKAKRVAVEIALDDGTDIAVTGALEAGARVVTVGVAELEDGMQVRLREPEKEAKRDDAKGDDAKGDAAKATRDGATP